MEQIVPNLIPSKGCISFALAAKRSMRRILPFMFNLFALYIISSVPFSTEYCLIPSFMRSKALSRSLFFYSFGNCTSNRTA